MRFRFPQALRQGRRATLGLAAVASAAMVVFVGSSTAGADTSDPRFERIPDAFNYANFKPAMLQGDKQLRVILKLEGAPVAKQDAKAKERGRPLSPSEKAAIRAQLKSQQSGLAGQIQALGGEVIADYQDAYNGVAVRIAQSKLTSLASLPGVVGVHPARIFEPDNTNTVAFVGGNTAWNDTGVTGDGVKLAVIDTGVDYFHANFGGSGDPADFANDDGTTIAGGSFPTAKVVGGTDFVGDAYNASSDDPAVNTPAPDPDPKDCNGHGSHVGGTAAGFGVLSTGATYAGAYNGSTLSSNTFRIGPGVAPEADILAYRVFGCGGSASEEVIVDAIDQAVLDGADVINMSLGSPFGRTDEPSAEASDNAAEDGVVVVASAGNNGPSGYITGAPAIASRALSVAALDAVATLPVASLDLNPGPTITVQNSNNAVLPGGALPIAVLRTSYPGGPISLGCSASDYSGYPGGVAGKLVVTLRGVCARVDRAILGQAAGAAAVAMINTANAFPSFEGKITGVTIPFLGVKGTTSTDDDNLVAADTPQGAGGTGTLAALAPIANPTFKNLASFSSGGPRNVDSAFKPEVTAPGVSVTSTGVGSGNEEATISGTSMSAPATAGVAALVVEANPSWSTEEIKAAIINTADPTSAKINSINVRTAGSGVVQAQRAVNTVGFITVNSAVGKDTIDFGYESLAAAFSETKTLTLHNTTGSPITYNMGTANTSLAGGTISFSSSPATVPANSTATVDVTLSLSAAAIAALPAATVSNFGAIATIRGAVTATPTSGGTGIYTLRVPFIAAPRGLSDVDAGPLSAYTKLTDGIREATLPLLNSGIHGGTADLYGWGISDGNDSADAEDGYDIRAVGVQALPGPALGGSADDRALVFAVNMHGRWSNPSVNEIDISIDLQNDGRPEFFVVGVDLGAVLAGSFDGRYASFIFDAAGNLINAWVATAPMNGSTMLLPTLASDIGLDPLVNSTKFNYAAAAFTIVPGGLVDVTGTGTFRSHQPPVSSGDFASLGPGGGTSWTLSVDKGKQASAPQLGWLVVTHDDANGAAQTDEVPLGAVP